MMLHAGFMHGMGRGQGSLFVVIFQKVSCKSTRFLLG